VNAATLSSSVADPVAANNSATATVNVTMPPQDADLSITKTTPAASINLGTPLRYDLVIVNVGPSSAAGVVVTDPLPAGVIYDATASSPSCAESGGTVTCFLGALPAGATVARAIVVMPTQAGTLVNIASVSSATADPQAGNNSAGVTVEVVAAGAGENIDPSAAGEQYAYGENVGWLNLEPLGDGGPGVEVTSSGLTGWMWGENVGWCSLSCATTGACGTTDYGVTNDGAGQLGGFAWCENVGWVSFACENTNSCSSADYGVAIDPSTGIFAGTAWGENLGWIAFEGSGPVPYQIVTSWRGSTAAPPQ
jgi:uncharacterized repeat protein (TIGR01451 family)